MAVQTAACAIIYVGNGSSTAPYAVPFSYLADTDIVVAVTPSGGSATVLNRGTDYTLTDTTDTDGNITGGSIVIPLAYDNTHTITIFRQTALLQPLVLPEAGQLPIPALETELDRLTFVLQEQNRRMLALEGASDQGAILVIPQSANGGDPTQDVATFADATARGSALPKRLGQLGVQISDNTLWMANGIGAGSWLQIVTVNNLTVGTVTTGTAGATITGSPPNQVLNLTLPTASAVAAPTVSSAPVDQSATLGASLGLSAAATSSGLRWQWVDGYGNVRSNRDSCNLSAVKVTDYGTWTVTVSNDSGSDSHSFQLWPPVAELLQDITPTVGIAGTSAGSLAYAPNITFSAKWFLNPSVAGLWGGGLGSGSSGAWNASAAHSGTYPAGGNAVPSRTNTLNGLVLTVSQPAGYASGGITDTGAQQVWLGLSIPGSAWKYTSPAVFNGV